MAERPDRYRNAIAPHIYVQPASDGITFYERAFGTVELFRVAHPNGKILHAEISICGSTVMIGDPDDELYREPRHLGRTTASLHIFVEENGTLLRRAIEAGEEQIPPPTDMFYGANSASLRDLSGTSGCSYPGKKILIGRDRAAWKCNPTPIRVAGHSCERRGR